MTRALRLVLGSLCLLLGAAAPALQASEASRAILQLPAGDLPALKGQRIETLRLGTVRDGRLVPIPFQVDEYNEAGLVWFPALDIPLKGTQGIYDGDDRLLFIFADASPEQIGAPPVVAGWLGEIAVQYEGEKRYVQVFNGEFPLSNTVYVRHDVQGGTTHTPFYTLRVDPKNELNWQHLMVRTWRGDTSRSLVDTLKMRISGGVFTSFTRLSLDNDNLRPKIVGVRSGPIRSTMQLETAVVVTGVTVMKMQVQVLRYPHYFEAYTHARIPSLYRKVLKEPEVRVTIDGNDLRGAIVRTARSGLLQALVDGETDEYEQQIIQRGLSAQDDWILFDSRGGFSILTFLEVPEELRNVPLVLVYEDAPEKSDKPEQFPGQSPNLGYGISGFPPGEDFRFGVTLAFDDDLRQVDPREYASRFRARPQIGFRAP
jgi:hypothetical protein